MKSPKITRSIRGKLTLLVGLLVLGSISVIGGLTYWRSVEMAKQIAINGLKDRAQLVAQQFNETFNELKNDVFIVSHLPPIDGIIRSHKHGGRDPIDGSSGTEWRKRLETIFKSIMLQRPHYTQMRYIGFHDNGRELVRVNRVNNTLSAVASANLQPKAEEPYMLMAKNLSEGEMFVSDVTYNREHSTITPDKTPTLRALIPVFDEDSRFGVIVVNINYEALLQKKLKELKINGHEIIILNYQGDYARYSPESGLFPFEFHEDYTQSPPETVKQVMALSSKTDEEMLLNTQEHIGYLVRLPVNARQPEKQINIILKMTRAALMEEAYNIRNLTLFLMVILLALSLTITLFLVRRFTYPLLNMTQNINETASFHKELSLPVDLDNEVGQLARALQQELGDSDARANAVLSKAIDAIIIINAQGIIIDANPATETLFGYKQKEVLGNNVSMLMPEPYHSAHDGYLKRYLESGDRRIVGIVREVRAKRKDGSTFPMELAVSEIRQKGEIFFTGIVRDVTERKQAEAEREQLITRLAHSNEELDKFAYIASHDLKAPLRAIDSISQWLSEDLKPYLKGENLENMRLLRNRVHRMEKLLEDLLQYSRIGRKMDGAFEEWVRGDVLLQDVIELIAPPTGFDIHVDKAFTKHQLVRMPLQHIFMNLLGNAIKHHNKTHGRIDVTLEESADALTFAIRDDGPGIPEQYHTSIFNMFETLQPRDRVEGSGMGLAMVRKYLEHYGGSISLESTEGEGTCFTFTWPKKAGSAHTAKAA